ncbi:hypothetical protein LX64_00947 [Chitinophaga skermanii]|uniref:Trypsin-like peptidase n=2 Tax=Chitinophaga skermanii TaxID=331697 RepID=A0A327QVA0_9BACT|nr:hypothetical protein LX64_00947 [Chitinophaga skermanii]
MMLLEIFKNIVYYEVFPIPSIRNEFYLNYIEIVMKGEQKNLTVPEVAVRSSIQIFLAAKTDMKPIGFGSGCILFHRDRYFLVSVRHVTEDDTLGTYLETGIPSEEEGKPGFMLKPMGGLCYFDLYKVSNAKEIKELDDLFKAGEKMDITFAEIKENFELRQEELDFKAFKISQGHKMILDSRNIVEPSPEKTYCFFGRIRPDYSGMQLKMENTFKHSIKFHGTNKSFQLFVSPQVITDKYDYKGCSGAPIVDSDGFLVGLVSKVLVPSKVIYGFSFIECIKLLDLAIDTGMLSNEIPIAPQPIIPKEASDTDMENI